MIEVLRLGHRRARDPRLTTHVALTARAFGADAVIVSEPDAKLESTIAGVVDRFGGPFRFSTGVPWRPFVRSFKDRGGFVIHLTMYGEPLSDATAKVPEGVDVLIVVGSEKVPAELYGLADLNVAVGNQPHSEVAALALTLDRLTKGRWKDKQFDGHVRVLPNPRGKTITEA